MDKNFLLVSSRTLKRAWVENINMDHIVIVCGDATTQGYLFLYILLKELPLCSSARGSQISETDNGKERLH
jgi:hypothetical protein